MKKFPLLISLFVMFSCLKSEVKQYEDGLAPAIDATGRQYDFLDSTVLTYCGPGWGRKFCRFLNKYNGTIWADANNYYSDFSDIKFSKFEDDHYFISFFDLDTIITYCKGWKLGDTTYEGIKWRIEIKKDEEDVFWFSYDYYGSSEEIESTTIYKYEVIDSLLHFSTTDGQTFIFHPSEKNYSTELVATDEIIELEGCMFN